MNGQKVVKAFCHESAAEADFDERNEKLFEVSQKANMYANILMPILMNLGNLLYVLVALAGGIFLALGVPNLSISGMALSIAVVVPFLNMTKQFCGQYRPDLASRSTPWSWASPAPSASSPSSTKT